MMGTRALDWFAQAERDLGHARNSRAAGNHDWACFASQQAADKAVDYRIIRERHPSVSRQRGLLPSPRWLRR